MPKGPEARFKESIHRLLPVEIYKEGMANPYRGGTPDNYYEGKSNHLWVEYKYIKNFPRKPLDLSDKYLSPLQSQWLDRAHSNGIPVAVCAGLPDKTGILLWGSMYKTHLSAANLKEIAVSKKEIANMIERFIC